MIVMTQVSGIADTPPTDKAYVFAHTNGNLGVKTPDGITEITLPPSLASGLYDVVGTFAEGETPRFDGTVFRPATVAAVTSVYTKTTGTGTNQQFSAVLASGFIDNGGTPSTIVFSGFDQTFDWLEIRGSARSTPSTAATQVLIYFNNDTTNANYRNRGYISAASHTNPAPPSGVIGDAQGLTSLNSNNGDVGQIHFHIPEYSSSPHRKYAYTPCLIPYNTAGTAVYAAGNAVQWVSDYSAINMIELKPVNAGVVSTFVSGTAIYLIGHKQHYSVNASGTYANVKINNGLVIP